MENIPRGYIIDIEKATIENTDFRRVMFTAKHMQLVLMRLRKSEAIGEEVHHLDQFIRVEEGDGEVELDGKRYALPKNFAVVIPAGTKHNIFNVRESDLKLYTLYAPPEHKDGVVVATQADAQEEHFDGIVSKGAR